VSTAADTAGYSGDRSSNSTERVVSYRPERIRGRLTETRIYSPCCSALAENRSQLKQSLPTEGFGQHSEAPLSTCTAMFPKRR
jgi:hypothetical protein